VTVTANRLPRPATRRDPLTANRSVNRRNADDGRRTKDDERRTFLQVVTTTDQRVVARRLARECVEQRLAACAQVLGPIESTYHWQGEIVEAREWICLFKTRRSLYPRLELEIRRRHNYAVPEIVALPIQEMSESYREWLDKELA
jgi:periplasmic divalent cation tolerance protein